MSSCLTCCGGIKGFLASFCGSTVSHTAAPTTAREPCTITLAAQPAFRVQEAAETLGSFHKHGRIFYKIKLKRIFQPASPVMMKRGFYSPRADYTFEPYCDSRMAARVKRMQRALTHYAVSEFNQPVKVRAEGYLKEYDVKKIFETVLDEKSTWNAGVNWIRRDIEEHRGDSLEHQQFIHFNDKILTPLVKEALAKAPSDDLRVVKDNYAEVIPILEVSYDEPE